MTTRVLIAAVAATASLVAACGGEGKGASPTATAAQSKEAANKKAMLAFASCMRKHGVDMPDPKFQGGRVTMQAGGPNTDRDTMRAADKACGKYRDAVKPPELSAGQREEFKKEALANARCMREHGIDKFPDPTFDENGGAQIKLERSSGLDPQDPKFKQAMEACRSTMPGAGTTDSTDEDDQ
jgi:hypothetical protein